MNISLFLVLFSLFSLIFAYTSQYAFGMAPCILCLYQRIPFFAVLLVSFISMFVKNNKIRLTMIAFCGILLLVGAGIAFYHVGVEVGRFESTSCEDVWEMPSTLEEMAQQMMGKANVPCDKPEFVFMGVSMAGWNFLFSSSIGLITLIIVFRIYKNIRFIEKSDGYKKEED